MQYSELLNNELQRVLLSMEDLSRKPKRNYTDSSQGQRGESYLHGSLWTLIPYWSRFIPQESNSLALLSCVIQPCGGSLFGS